ncbi:MAG: hypothetical protein IKP16_01635 [Prevotella sp.]|nr:hypothetical protein [Prevotella sp.]MBR6124629.1 hypothetical protein [Candidatus Saccharibacteria bacterium]
MRIDKIQLQFIVEQQHKGDALEKTNEELCEKQKLGELERKKNDIINTTRLEKTNLYQLKEELKSSGNFLLTPY